MNDIISIIIPMYNAEKFIGRLLNCLKEQTYKNLEIIDKDRPELTKQEKEDMSFLSRKKAAWNDFRRHRNSKKI